MAGAIDAVVFDLGGVLIDWSPHHLYRSLFADDPAIAAFLAETGLTALNVEFDGGRPMGPALTDLAARLPHHAEAIHAWARRWPEMLGGEVPGTAAILTELDERGVPLYALTNWSAETFRFGRERFSFLTRFRHIVVSGEIGLVKPDAAIFHHLLARAGTAPERTFFIDDSARNVDAAAALGMVAHRFVAAPALRAALAAHRLL